MVLSACSDLRGLCVLLGCAGRVCVWLVRASWLSLRGRVERDLGLVASRQAVARDSQISTTIPSPSDQDRRIAVSNFCTCLR